MQSATNAKRFVFIYDIFTPYCYPQALTFVLDHNKTIINFVCGSMPIIAGVCESLVEDLIKNVTAAKICVDLHLCDKSNLAPLSVPSGGLCVECEQVSSCIFLSNTRCYAELTFLQTARFLSSNTESIQNYLSAICKKINSESVCDLFVNHFVDILRNSNPTEMCQESRLCKEPAQLILGADLCTQGPSYWCASLDNAKECGAFDFCNEKYWVQ